MIRSFSSNLNSLGAIFQYEVYIGKFCTSYKIMAWEARAGFGFYFC